MGNDPAGSYSRPERIWDRALAEAIQARCEGKTGEVSEEKKAQTQIAPQLYDLTTLQREAPFSAKATLQIAQALYEKHKVVTDLEQSLKNKARLGRLERFHDAVQKKEEAFSLFNLGYLDLENRAAAESLFWQICEQIAKEGRKTGYQPEVKREKTIPG